MNGVYHKLDCEHSISLSAIWRRQDEKVFLFFRPNVARAKLDTAVFATSPNHADSLEICELQDWIPENALNDSTHTTKAKFFEWNAPRELMKVEVPPPSMEIIQQNQTFEESLATSTSSISAYPVLCEMGGLSPEVISSLLEYNKSTSRSSSEIDLVGKFGTRNAKRLSIVASPSLLKCAAQGKLPLSLSKWYKLTFTKNIGLCEINVPPRPSETWKKISSDKGIVFERIYDAEESNEYYQVSSPCCFCLAYSCEIQTLVLLIFAFFFMIRQRLLSRPSAFRVEVSQADEKLVVSMNPYVGAHRAAAILGGEEIDSVGIEYCLSELSSMGEPDTKDFRVPNSDEYNPTEISDLELPLYTRQAKALSRMLDIENGSVQFSEEERSEHILPGIGWCLIAKASKKSPLRGGVLGDAIGSGEFI